MSRYSELADILQQKHVLENEIKELQTVHAGSFHGFSYPDMVASLEHQLRKILAENERLVHAHTNMDHYLNVQIPRLQVEIADLQTEKTNTELYNAQRFTALDHEYALKLAENVELREELCTRRKTDDDHLAALYFVNQYGDHIDEEIQFWPLMDALKIMTPDQYSSAEIKPIAFALQNGSIPRGPGIWTEGEDSQLESALRQAIPLDKAIVRKHGLEKTAQRAKWIACQQELDVDEHMLRHWMTRLMPERFCKFPGCGRYFKRCCRLSRHRHNARHHSQFGGVRRSNRLIGKKQQGRVQVVI